MFAFLGCGLGFLAILATGEVLHSEAHVDGEHTRRLVHIASGVFAAFLPWWLTWWQIVALTAVFELVIVVSMRYDRLPSVHDVARTTWGAVCFPAGVAAVAVAQPPNASFAFGVLAMALGDGLAGMVGQFHGRHAVCIGRATKTLEGTATCFVVTLAVALEVLRAAGGVDSLALVATALVSAVVVTGVELVTPYGVDNLFIPLAGALTMWGLVTIMG